MSRNEKAREVTGDEDTDSILADMERDGEQLPVFADAPSEDDDSEEPEDAAEAADEDEEESEEEESEDTETKDEESEDEEEESDTEEGEDEEGDSDDEDDKSEEDQDRTPLWKRHKELKKELKAAKTLLETLSKQTTEAELDSKVESFSKKFNISKDAAKEMVQMAASLAAKQAGIDPELKKSLESLTKRDAEQKYWDGQDKAFRKDFTQNVAPLIARDGKDLSKIQKELRAISFTPENVEKSLVTLYLEKYGKTEGHRPRTTTEGNRTHGRIPSKKTQDLLPEDIDSMSDEEFDEYSESMGKESKSRIVRH